MEHTHAFQLLDVVALRSEQGSLAAGALGTVLEVFSKPEPAYLVEFADENGVEIETLALLPSQIEPVAKP